MFHVLSSLLALGMHWPLYLLLLPGSSTVPGTQKVLSKSLFMDWRKGTADGFSLLHRLDEGWIPEERRCAI